MFNCGISNNTYGYSLEGSKQPLRIIEEQFQLRMVGMDTTLNESLDFKEFLM